MPDSKNCDDEWLQAMSGASQYLRSPPGQTKDDRVGMSIDIDYVLGELEDRFSDSGDAVRSLEGNVQVFELEWKWTGHEWPTIVDIHRDVVRLWGELADDHLFVRRTVGGDRRTVVFNVLAGSADHSHPLQFRIGGPDVERALT